jgi:transposase InsO family protein
MASKKEVHVMAQVHKNFTDSQVRELFDRYVKGEIKRKHIQAVLGIKKSRFFELLKLYRENEKDFSIEYSRKKPTRGIDPAIEKNIYKELKVDKELIVNPATPIRAYNYSYIKDRLEKKHKQKVSVPTIIDRAKKGDYYLKKKQKKTHDREVLTNYVGELIQHDASYHLFAPHAGKKWHLITSIDDFSRYLLHAALLERESSWAHIHGLEVVIVTHGFPVSYYIDSHSIFRFVRGRDEIHYKHHLQTDDTDPQWKQVLRDCRVDWTHALSPQAKGKIERPYRWIQDHLARTCFREKVTDIADARNILKEEIREYNYKRVHSTTGEIPHIRFKNALRDKKTLFRKFEIPKPYESVRDIFCFRITRVADGYRRVGINNVQFKVNKVNPMDKLNLRIYPISKLYSEVRFWRGSELLDIQKIKNEDLKRIIH